MKGDVLEKKLMLTTAELKNTVSSLSNLLSDADPTKPEGQAT